MVGNECDAIRTCTEFPVKAGRGGVAVKGQENRVEWIVWSRGHCGIEELYAVGFGQTTLAGVGSAG